MKTRRILERWCCAVHRAFGLEYCRGRRRTRCWADEPIRAGQTHTGTSPEMSAPIRVSARMLKASLVQQAQCDLAHVRANRIKLKARNQRGRCQWQPQKPPQQPPPARIVLPPLLFSTPLPAAREANTDISRLILVLVQDGHSASSSCPGRMSVSNELSQSRQ